MLVVYVRQTGDEMRRKFKWANHHCFTTACGMVVDHPHHGFVREAAIWFLGVERVVADEAVGPELGRQEQAGSRKRATGRVRATASLAHR
jgi:hypothetical protein